MVKKVTTTCNWCFRSFEALLKEVNRGRGKFCGISCANAFKSSSRKNPNSRKEWIEKNKNTEWYVAQRKAHHAVEQALRTGRLAKRDCERCGSDIRVHAHHDDYSKPLAVEWLCVSCHRKHHGGSVRESSNLQDTRRTT